MDTVVFYYRPRRARPNDDARLDAKALYRRESARATPRTSARARHCVKRRKRCRLARVVVATPPTPEREGDFVERTLELERLRVSGGGGGDDAKSGGDVRWCSGTDAGTAAGLDGLALKETSDPPMESSDDDRVRARLILDPKDRFNSDGASTVARVSSLAATQSVRLDMLYDAWRSSAPLELRLDAGRFANAAAARRSIVAATAGMGSRIVPEDDCNIASISSDTLSTSKRVEFDAQNPATAFAASNMAAEFMEDDAEDESPSSASMSANSDDTPPQSQNALDAGESALFDMMAANLTKSDAESARLASSLDVPTHRSDVHLANAAPAIFPPTPLNVSAASPSPRTRASAPNAHIAVSRRTPRARSSTSSDSSSSAATARVNASSHAAAASAVSAASLFARTASTRYSVNAASYRARAASAPTSVDRSARTARSIATAPGADESPFRVVFVVDASPRRAAASEPTTFSVRSLALSDAMSIERARDVDCGRCSMTRPSRHKAISQSIITRRRARASMSVTLHTTLGELKLELHCADAPKSCENFLALCASGYYDGCAFHRCVKGFMIQSGDPTGTGRGGASIYGGGTFKDELSAHLTFSRRGVLAMANAGPNTNGSQFFLSFAKLPHLNGKVTIFGQLIDGHGTLDSLERLAVDERDRPVRDVKIERVTIHANPVAG